MIIFEKIRWKNLLSTGNTFTELDLNKNKTTLIVGTNGGGKSTFLDALSFALYKKAFRNVNLPQLVNSITGKGLLVEVEFNIGGRKYLVRRGIKPNIFEIHQDGKLFNQDADNRDYQDMLEKSILKMNHKSFRQIVVLGSADFVPFMQLPAQSRREVIEDLLDIQIFSVMNNILKNRVLNNRNAIVDIDHQIDLQQKMLALHEKHLNELNRNNSELIDQKTKKIDSYIQENTMMLIQAEAIQSQLEDLTKELSNNEKYKSKLSEAEEISRKIANKAKNIARDLKFYIENDSCPTCQQDINDTFKSTIIEKRKTQQQTNSDMEHKIQEKIRKFRDRVKAFEVTAECISNFQKSISEINVRINSNNKFIESLRTDIDETKNKIKLIKKEKTSDQEIKQKIKELHKIKKNVYEERELLGVASFLLKDGGIKTIIIRQYVPIMNKLINSYLAHMDFFVEFTLDEQFKETIRSRYRDDFSYASFSQGEKMRIDLAILFAWRNISRMKNSSSCNLLVFDEIFDSSLDSTGTEDFIKILNGLTKDNNTFIISHKVDALVDKFDHVIRFNKSRNFSSIAA